MRPLKFATTFPIKNYQFQKNDTLVNKGITSVNVAQPYKVKNYAELVDMVARLAYFNNRYVLFFRGQSQEYRVGSPHPTIYPNYFRELIQEKATISQLMDRLFVEQEMLKHKNHNRSPRFHGASLINEYLHIRWALIQHYEICETPLIDITQSLHVAASFALLNKPKSKEAKGIIYVVALPWPSKNYHSNKEEDIYLVRLAGITPPQAKRPYRQEAYAVMSMDVDIKQSDNLSRYDLSNRVVCKFEINNSKEFWGSMITPLPKSFLVPKQDIFYDFIKEDFSTKSNIR